ncbi:MAG TPA: hypothetical protein VLA34_08840, partial [Candidatus Krumholzibacterium sp.]|nr:hypothetical protein [Candidatus Krumholzibacterium sp.]
MKRTIILLSCLSIFLPGAARSLTITVDWDGSRDAVTIQEGIDMAQNGDWLRINAGTYYETDITLDGKDLTIWYGVEGIPVIKSPADGTGTGLILRNVT